MNGAGDLPTQEEVKADVIPEPLKGRYGGSARVAGHVAPGDAQVKKTLDQGHHTH